MRLTHIAERVFNTPLLMEQGKLDAILAVLGPRIGLEAQEIPEGHLNQADKRDIYSVSDSGIAVIDIAGSLVNRQLQGVEALSGLTSYEEIAAELDKAMSDPGVRGVMLRINSGGGEASGNSDLSRTIREATKQKPVWASVDSAAYSAAYWIASATNRIYVTETAGVGSIGVIARHVDQSKMSEAKGVKITTVFAGAHKNDMSPFSPLSDEARQRLQAEVDQLYGMFVDAVAENRGMAKKAVRGTEAMTYMGQKGIDAGLADRIGTFRVAMSDMEGMLKRGKREDVPAIITERKSEKRDTASCETRQLEMVEVREVGSADEPKITGHIAVFNRFSLNMGGFRERIMPGAFAKTIKEADIHHYFNHDTNIILGRSKSGTLRLTEDESGLYIENDPPNTQTVRDLVLEPLRRGDIDQGSFGFAPVRQEWGRMDGELVRTLHEIRLYHTSIVPHGAYPDTAVALRCVQALEGAPDIDLSALHEIRSKCQSNIALSDEESAFLQESLRSITSLKPVTPGLAAHLTSEAPPPNPMALRYRLELARLRKVS